MKILLVLATALFSFSAIAQISNPNPNVLFTPRDLATQENYSLVHLIKNISTFNEAVGAVTQYRALAQMDQNVHSTRDAALAMDMTLELYVRYPVGNEKTILKKLLLEQLQFNQKTIENSANDNLSLGNSFFKLTGEISNLVPARFQTEATALRTIATIKLYNLARIERWPEFAAIRRLLYDNTIGSKGLLKMDLDFIQRAWSVPSFDLWGQVKGRHFANLMLLKKALVGGSQIASMNGDFQSSRNYMTEAGKINQELNSFWDASKNSLRCSKTSLTGSTTKSFLWDSSVLFGALEGQLSDGNWDYSDDRLLASLDQMQEAFRRIYPTNQNTSLAAAIGHYPEESQGNPSVQMTNMMAEYHYQLAMDLSAKGAFRLSVANIAFYRRMAGDAAGADFKPGVVVSAKHPIFKLILKAIAYEGDRYLARTILYKNNDGSLSEQFSRLTGYQQGPASATAATVSFLSAKSVRDQMMGSKHKLGSFLVKPVENK